MTGSHAKVTLFIPNSRWYGKRPWLIPPYVPVILTAILKDFYDFSILDANIKDLTEEECVLLLKDLQSEIVLVSALSVEYSQQYHRACSLAKEAFSDSITVMGGVYPTVMGEEILKDDTIDYIFLGHAEERVLNFLALLLKSDSTELQSLPGTGFRDTSGSIVINPVASYILDIKTQIKPDYSMIDVGAYSKSQYNSKDYQFNTCVPTMPITTSYGCPYNCVFCATRTISGRGLVFREVDDVLEEIDSLISEYGIKSIVFLDDCLLADEKRIYRLLQALMDRNYDLSWKAASVSAWHLNDKLLELMRKSGCVQITISVESGSQRVLKDIIRKPLKLDIVPPIVKKCKALDIDIGANFVIGFPGETWEDLRATFRFAELCDFDLAHFHIATPLPKTDLYKMAKKQNLLPEDFNFTDPRYFGFGRGFIETDDFSPFELMVLRAFEWDRINFSTPEKTVKVARMMKISLEELHVHRKKTRMNCGVHF